MPNGGTLTISGEIDQSADLICLAVTDTGCGIEPHDLPRIFEPFYSTKTDGRGNGLGLAMVYGIIREHHGTVEVESEPGKGSTFRIKLPRNPVSCSENGYPQDKASMRSIGNSHRQGNHVHLRREEEPRYEVFDTYHGCGR